MKLSMKDGKYYLEPEGGWNKEEINLNKLANQAINYPSNFSPEERDSKEIRDALSKMMNPQGAL